MVPSGIYKGRYGWQVDQPLILTIQNDTQQNKREIDVKMTIVRDSYLIDSKAINLDGTKGIGIAQVLVKNMSQGQVQEPDTTQQPAANT